MNPPVSFNSRMRSEIKEIEHEIRALLALTTVTERNNSGGGLVVVGPRYQWSGLAHEHRPKQTALLQRYRRWFELFSKQHIGGSDDLLAEISELHDAIISAIELKSGWHVHPTVEANQNAVSESIAGLLKLSPEADSPMLMLVPDTNSLLMSSDPVDYRVTSGSTTFQFVFCPTVLSELDKLKISRRDQSLGERAEKAIRRIKGYRAQGPVLQGVTVDKSITVKMIPTEPRMTELPNWLDASNNDDRLIGSCLELQFRNPAATVLLVTGDINLQNKAEMALLPFCEPPQAQLPPAAPTFRQSVATRQDPAIEDRIQAVDVAVEITQGTAQTFIFSVRNNSDEEVSVSKVTFNQDGFKVAEWEAEKSNPRLIPARSFASISWNPAFDPVERLQTSLAVYDRQFETAMEIKVQFRVLERLRFSSHKIRVQLDLGGRRIWQR